MSAHLGLWTVIAVCLGGCASLPSLPPPRPHTAISETTPAPADAVYTIGSEDTLNINVYGHPDLTIDVTVSLDGSFVYPLLGVVQAAGLTARQLERQMAQALVEYLVDPQVRIVVKEFQSQRVHVLGAVRNPGTYVLKHASTLIEMLAAAGGPTPEAGWEVSIVRMQQGENGPRPETEPAAARNGALRVDLEQLLAGEIPQPIIYNGDTVYMPKAAFFYVRGQVTRPGQYRLERDTTVAKALAMATDVTRFAATKRLKVERVVAGQRREFRVGLTDLLQAGDVLIVPESFF